MTTTNEELRKKISEEFAKGNMEFCDAYLADDIRWNILGSEAVVGKQQVLEAMKMLQLETFPIITIKNLISEGDYVVVESTGAAITKTGNSYNQSYCDVFKFYDKKLHDVSTYLDTALSKSVLIEPS